MTWAIVDLSGHLIFVLCEEASARQTSVLVAKSQLYSYIQRMQLVGKIVILARMGDATQFCGELWDQRPCFLEHIIQCVASIDIVHTLIYLNSRVKAHLLEFWLQPFSSITSSPLHKQR